jgi:hypothetical protein
MRLLTLLRNRLYSTHLLRVRRSSLIAYWPAWEPSGTTIVDASGNARTGTYTAVTLAQPGIGDGRTAATFDGTTSLGNIYGASLAAAFSPLAGTAVIWFKVASAGVWTDGASRYLFNLRADANNRVSFRKSATNGTFTFEYVAGGTSETVSVGSLSSTGWVFAAITWDKAGDTVRMGLNGGLSGAQTGVGVWAGALAATATLLGANASTPTNVWSGSVAHAAVWSATLTAGEIATLARRP